VYFHSYFTIPEPLVQTINSSSLTTVVAAAISKLNLTNSLNALNNVTVFVPSDAAVQAANVSLASAQTLINGLVIPNFVGYTPAITPGNPYVTLGGTTLTVSVASDGTFSVNGAQIIQSDLVTANGVVHILGSVSLCLTLLLSNVLCVLV
jgi:uncharacterized surface protein with fasciclin (FAS1) repeats